MKKFIIGSIFLFLSGCASAPVPVNIITTKYKVVIPPASMLRCGQVKLPDIFFDNKGVAQSYIKLWKHNQFCSNNMKAIKNYFNEAQSTVK
jgi:hypothetical protein